MAPASNEGCRGLSKGLSFAGARGWCVSALEPPPRGMAHGAGGDPWLCPPPKASGGHRRIGALSHHGCWGEWKGWVPQGAAWPPHHGDTRRPGGDADPAGPGMAGSQGAMAGDSGVTWCRDLQAWGSPGDVPLFFWDDEALQGHVPRGAGQWGASVMTPWGAGQKGAGVMPPWGAGWWQPR